MQSQQPSDRKVSFNRTGATTYEETHSLSDHTSVKHGSFVLLVGQCGRGTQYSDMTADQTLHDWNRSVTLNQTVIRYKMKAASTQLNNQRPCIYK